MRILLLILRLAHYGASFLYFFYLLYISDKVIKVNDLWSHQLDLQQDFEHPEICHGLKENTASPP
jgi:hypothetical protein